MKIAFDVKGTLYGSNQDNVRRLFNALEKRGHTMFVWSNSFSYAINAVKDLQLNAVPMDKKGKFDYPNKEDYMDLAIEDDRSQTWLAAKYFIFVADLSDESNVDAVIKELTDGKA